MAADGRNYRSQGGGSGGWKAWLWAGAGLLTLALCVLAGIFPTFPGDEAALVRFQAWQSPVLTTVMRSATLLGNTPVAFSLVVLVVLALLGRRLRAEALALALIELPVIVGVTLKAVVGRPRPEYTLLGETPGNLSFPSGHALFAMLFLGFLLLLAGERVTRPTARRLLQAGLALLILLVGASRVYLGVHWPSDVIGGFLLGGLALPLLFLVRNRARRTRWGAADQSDATGQHQ